MRIPLGLCLALVSAAATPKDSSAQSDETLILETLDTFAKRVIAQDIDGAMSLISESFSGLEGETKQSSRETMNAMKDAGGLDNIEVSIDEASIVMNNAGTATVTVRVMSPDADISERLTLSKEEGSWLVSSIEILP